MTFHGFRTSVWLLVAGAVCVLGASGAQAGSPFVGPTTVHVFKAQLKGALQGANNADRDIIERHSVNQKDIAEDCVGEPLEKLEKVVMVSDCGDVSPPFEVRVFVVDTSTDPATILNFIGGASLAPVARKENKDDETTQLEYQLSGGLGCLGLSVGLTGYATASFKPLDPKDADSPICMQSANGKVLGSGMIAGDDVVLESGKFSAGDRSKKIDVPANAINDWFE